MRQRSKIELPNPSGSEFENFDRVMTILVNEEETSGGAEKSSGA